MQIGALTFLMSLISRGILAVVGCRRKGCSMGIVVVPANNLGVREKYLSEGLWGGMKCGKCGWCEMWLVVWLVLVWLVLVTTRRTDWLLEEAIRNSSILQNIHFINYIL